MKKKALIGAGLAFSVATASWAAGAAEQSRSVSSFDEVSLHGSMNVDIRVGEEQSIRVVADDNIIDELETVVRGDKLRIRLKDGHYGRIKKMHVYVTVPTLKAGSIHGSGDMKIVGSIDGDFEFSVHGSGDSEIDEVNAGALELNIHGSGDVRLDGTCDDVEISVHGSGNVLGKGMKCESADVDVHGSGDVAIHAVSKIEASVFGSGDIDVYGAPDKVRTKVRGSGDISVH